MHYHHTNHSRVKLERPSRTSTVTVTAEHLQCLGAAFLNSSLPLRWSVRKTKFKELRRNMSINQSALVGGGYLEERVEV